MIQVNLHDFKAHLSDYARRVKAGETLVICERNRPIGEFRPLSTDRPAPGLFKHQIQVPDAFFAADGELTADFLDGE